MTQIQIAQIQKDLLEEFELKRDRNTLLAKKDTLTNLLELNQNKQEKEIFFFLIEELSIILEVFICNYGIFSFYT